jgi:hypothetical protein
MLAPGSGAAQPNLFEWLALAPVVVAGENLGTYGKYAEFQVEGLLRGEGAPQGVIRVNVRRANRDRNRQVDKEALRFDKGLSYLLLLTPVATRKPDALPTFELVRGARGAREIPPEGGETYLAAVRRFIRIQDRNDDLLTWREMSAMIEETNPILIQTALDQFLKFQRGDSELLGSLRPLLDHPSPLMRERAALLIGQILVRNGTEPLPDGPVLQSELVAKARRDSAVSVRVAATRALNGFDGRAVVEILEEIARADPDQAVRYTAERLIYERRTPRDGGEPAGNGPNTTPPGAAEDPD